MKTRFILILLASMLAANLSAQDTSLLPAFKPRYAGTSLSTGFMWTPGLGSAFFVAPKLSFQLKPRLFVNAGLTAVQYSLTPAQSKEFSLSRSATDVYLFAEGVYLLSERWSVNGSAMKSVSPKGLRNPYAPTEAVRVGLDFHITPHLSIGASIGYSRGNNPAAGTFGTFPNGRHFPSTF